MAGRKPLREGEDTVLLQIKIPREDRDRYQAVAEAAGVTVSDVVRDYLRRWAAQVER